MVQPRLWRSATCAGADLSPAVEESCMSEGLNMAHALGVWKLAFRRSCARVSTEHARQGVSTLDTSGFLHSERWTQPPSVSDQSCAGAERKCAVSTGTTGHHVLGVGSPVSLRGSTDAGHHIHACLDHTGFLHTHAGWHNYSRLIAIPIACLCAPEKTFLGA